MEFKDIQELIKLIGKTKLNEFKMKDGDFELLIRSESFTKGKAAPIIQQAPQVVSIPAPVAAPASPAPAPAPVAAAVAAPAPVAAASASAAPEDNSGYIEIKSPMIGTFYRSSSPDKPSLVAVGDSVTNDSVVCIIEAMKLFNEIEAEITGKIVKVLVEDAQPVQYDQPLFLVDPKG